MTHPAWIVMTDLDGTLLDPQRYDATAALPALAALREKHIPCLMNSSKTFSEMVQLRAQLHLDSGFACENGAALFVPKNGHSGYSSQDYNAEILGSSYASILKVLHQLRQQGFIFRGFNDMTALEVSSLTGLDVDSASRAKQRSGTEPLVWQDSEERRLQFQQQLQQHGLQMVAGGRFWHVMGQSDKADALEFFSNYYQQLWQRPIKVVALGDSDNDIPMLEAADLAIVLPGHEPALSLNNRNSRYCIDSASKGWNYAILDWLHALPDQATKH